MARGPDRYDLALCIQRLETLCPGLSGDTRGACELLLMVAKGALQHGSARSVAGGARWLLDILAADDVPAAILSHGKKMRSWLVREIEAERQRAPVAFTCPRCGRTSHHPQDAQHCYCANCHRFADEAPLP
jgi:hypothetical protein